MLNNKKSTLFFMIVFLGLTAYQKESSVPNSAKTSEASDQNLENHVKANLTSENQKLTAESCDIIDVNIKLLKQQFSPQHLLSLNKQFQRCLASVDLEQRYQWLSETDKIYAVQISKLPESVSNYIRQVSSEGLTLTETKLNQIQSQMTDQEKFIIDHQKDLYLAPYNLGEGDYAISQSPQYAYEIFAPHLPQVDQVFLKATLEQENAIKGSIDKYAGLSVSFDQLCEWITFWENYLKKYSKSHFDKDAQNKISFYEKYLFLGLENTPVFEINDYNVEMDPEARKAIVKLSKTNTLSAQKAQKLLEYFDQYAFAESQYDEETATQAEYNLFMAETQQGIQRFKENHSNDLIKLLNLKAD